MSLTREHLEELIYGAGDARRFTQDSPILPDVWIRFGEQAANPQELLLTPHAYSTTGMLFDRVRQRLERERASEHWRRRHPEGGHRLGLIYNESYVRVRLTFDELIRAVLPLSSWWTRHLWPTDSQPPGLRLQARGLREVLAAEGPPATLIDQLVGEPVSREERFAEDVLQFIQLAGAIAWSEAAGPGEYRALPLGWQKDRAFWEEVVNALRDLLEGIEGDVADEPLPPGARSEWDRTPLWAVSLNRTASRAVWRSRRAVKADAAIKLFDIRSDGLAWAVLDSGIDASHPAFLTGTPPPGAPTPWATVTRVVRTYDFNRLSALLDPDEKAVPDRASAFHALDPQRKTELEEDLRRSLQKGRAIDWDLLEPFLRIPHDGNYRPPVNEHGTHVAGILAGNWRSDNPEESLVGVCPDLQLYDLRVLDDNGVGSEFTVIAALQFLRHMNARRDLMLIHGANISISLSHDVANYACGRTPVCEECGRAVGSGVVIVVAAGNKGYIKYKIATGWTEDYRNISVTDPGNAEDVITVGSTHRFMPHTYGVSYFSSRGPTGDGRPKPDLVAPGEKIKSTVPGGDARTMDGTSMAAPHVSGAAALLLARNRELIGQPRRIKEILCRTATDLGRERSFQGAGMLDILRALQSV